MELNEIILKLEEAFKRDDVKKAVLAPKWYERNIDNKIDSMGFCYAASEVIFRLNGGKETWKKVSISEKKWDLGGHCYLENIETGEILDITNQQYTSKDIEIPYDKAVYGIFQTKDFGNDARKLAEMSGLIEL